MKKQVKRTTTAFCWTSSRNQLLNWIGYFVGSPWQTGIKAKTTHRPPETGFKNGGFKRNAR
jgi:hypothetical protein